MSADMRNPSEVTDDYWVRAFSSSRPKEIQYSGKWLVYVYPGDLDSTWAQIRDATMAGKLGSEAKAATALDNPNAVNETKLICVYTDDYRDIEDIRRVLIGLREMGISWRLSYKTDDATISGTYGAGASLYVSQPDTITFGLTSVPKKQRQEL